MTANPSSTSFARTAAGVVVFGLAMAYLESVVVVYLNGALGGRVGEIFPLRPDDTVGDLLLTEVGREVATLVMIAAVGILVGSTAVERLAWGAVVFGAWDIGYYAWLWLLAGWPTSLATVDLLFLLPVPWVGPVWSPLAVSVALVSVGLAAARRTHAGRPVALRAWHLAAGLAGGFLVILSYTVGLGSLIEDGMPGPYPWPLFVIGMLLAGAAALHALRMAAPGRGESQTWPPRRRERSDRIRRADGQRRDGPPG